MDGDNMEYIHVRNLDKYHPGYKDRTLQWAKIYFNMASGDADCEIIENEIDWSRLIRMILLELRNRKPLPNLDRYWSKNGFDIKKRPMSLTLKMLHNFIDIDTLGEKLFYVDKDKEEDKDKEKTVAPTVDKIQKTKYLDTVYLSEEEYENLVNRFGKEETEDKIESLNEGIMSKGYKYKSHFHTILSWHRKNNPKLIKNEERELLV